MMSELLPIGTRIVFTKTLTDGADENHPACLYANKDDYGVIVGHGTKEGYWVKVDWWSNKFGASSNEFEVTNPIASGLDRDTSGSIGQP
ncbi:MAG: hypothetical protein Q8J66_09230 [Methylotenera sp.]|nr:hypothetical protein [Methylotenera sp.]